MTTTTTKAKTMSNTTTKAQAATACTVRHLGIGIDTARYGHRVHFLREDRQPAAAALTVTENRQGYQALATRLAKLHEQFPQAELHVHIDAAGQYAANLIQFLRALALPLLISVGEPQRNKDYHKAHFPKRTSDDTESQAMARFGVVERPTPTPAVPEEFGLLREIAGRLQGLVKDSTRAINRFHNLMARVFPELAIDVSHFGAEWVLELCDKYPTPPRIAAVRLATLQKIPYLKSELAERIHAAAPQSVASLRGELAEVLVRESVQQIRQFHAARTRLEKLLLKAFAALPASGHLQVVTIPGIGEVTAAVLVAKMISITRFATPEHLTGYFGIIPNEQTSGVDRLGKTLPPGSMSMSAKGNDLVRSYLWNAAKSAIQHNPAVRELYARLRAKGTRGDVALGHCMRKLLHQVFGVWASDRPYDAELAASRHHPRDTTLTPPDTGTTPLANNNHAALDTEESAAGSANDGKTTPPRQPLAAETIEEAAGHKREPVPNRKVVTAAPSLLEPVTSKSVTAAPITSAPITSAPVTIVPRSARPRVDYSFLRQQISFETVLAHLNSLPQRGGRHTPQRRSHCPLCHTPNSFSVNLTKNIYRCFHSGCTSGNVLDFWTHFKHLSLHQAAVDLANTFQLQLQPSKTTPNKNSQKNSVTTPDAT